MQKSNLTAGLVTALLLASPLAGAESHYPAADFKPTIIFQDTDLIARHGQAATERTLAEQTKPNRGDGIEPTPSTALPATAGPTGLMAAEIQSPNPLAENYPMVLIAFTLMGFTLWNSKRAGAKVQDVRHDFTEPSRRATAETGVAKYLKNLPAKPPTAETGVARYLRELPSSAPAAETGVARYLKSLD
jgi:hypothetical protein